MIKYKTKKRLLNIKIINLFIISLFTLIFFSTSIFSESMDLDATLINQNPDPVRSGDILELKFSIENNGGISAKDVVGELQIQYPFVEIDGESLVKNIGSINSYQDEEYSRITNYKLLVDKDAPSGGYEIKLKLTNSTNNNITPVFSFNIDIIAKEYAQIITINKSNISFGEEEDLEFIITNTGNSPLQNIVFSWEDPEEVILPVLSDNTKYIKYLDVGENILVSYKVMASVDATPGLYKLNLNLSLENEDYQNSEINTIAGIFVGGTTDFAISSAESSSGEVSISIANIGNDPAYSVNIIVPEQDNFTVSGSNSSIVGNLDKGDYTIETFDIKSNIKTNVTLPSDKTNSNRPLRNNFEDLNKTTSTSKDSSNKLTVLIEYTDSIGIRHSLEKNINISLSENSQLLNANDSNRFKKQSSNVDLNLLIYIIVGCLVLFGVYKYLSYRKKKKIELKINKKKNCEF